MRLLSFIIALVLGASTFPARAQDDREQYVPPTNITLTLTPKAPLARNKPFSLIGRVEAVTGIPSQVEVFFEPSPNLEAVPKHLTLGPVGPKTPRDIEVMVTPVPGADGEEGSFVVMRVVYLPDYAHLVRRVTNPADFPNPGLRLKLATLMAGNLKNRIKQTDSIRFFPENALEEAEEAKAEFEKEN